jgi:TonB-dependent SusC/RagA subfamily outer membrane receptor
MWDEPAGTTPGLSIMLGGGEVGQDPLIKIRGQYASIQGSSSPLILMDNVQIPSIQMVNPDDIESISVLKDAASASIYGSKAAFG